MNNTHRKYFNKNNIEVPSVTTVLKLLAKPELVQWANYMGFKRINTTELLEEKANYGTRVHDLFERYNMGIIEKSTQIDLNFNDVIYKELLEKCKYFKNLLCSLGYEIIQMELPLEGDRFGGTLDLLIMNKQTGKLFILDLKTSKRLYNSMLIQLGGYTTLLKECYNLDVAGVGIILIQENINSKKFINMISFEDNIKNQEIFNKLLDIYYLNIQ